MVSLLSFERFHFDETNKYKSVNIDREQILICLWFSSNEAFYITKEDRRHRQQHQSVNDSTEIIGHSLRQGKKKIYFLLNHNFLLHVKQTLICQNERR